MATASENKKNYPLISLPNNKVCGYVQQYVAGRVATNFQNSVRLRFQSNDTADARVPRRGDLRLPGAHCPGSQRRPPHVDGPQHGTGGVFPAHYADLRGMQSLCKRSAAIFEITVELELAIGSEVQLVGWPMGAQKMPTMLHIYYHLSAITS